MRLFALIICSIVILSSCEKKHWYSCYYDIRGYSVTDIGDTIPSNPYKKDKVSDRLTEAEAKARETELSVYYGVAYYTTPFVKREPRLTCDSVRYVCSKI